MSTRAATSRHEALASAWASYNSISGRATAKQVTRIMQQCDVATLERLLAERGMAVVVAVGVGR